MPLITNAPILIDSTLFSRQSTQEINPMAFIKGTSLYLALLNDTSGLSIYKSPIPPINTASFVEKDAANSPRLRSTPFSVTTRSGSKIAIEYIDNATAKGAIIEFDTATDTYGVPSVSPDSVATANSAIIYQKSNGDYYIVFVDTGNLNYIKLSGGVWSGPTNITTASFLFSATIDSSDRAHIFYKAVNRLRYIQLDASDSPSASQNLLDGSNIGRLDVVIQANTLNAVFDNGQTADFITGTPLSNPVFAASVVLDTVAGAAQTSYGTIGINGSSQLTAFWVVTDFSTNPGIDELRYSTNTSGTTWSAPAVFYDEITNPPAGSAPYPSQFVHTGQALFSGGWMFPTAMEADSHCTGFMLVGPGVTPPIVISIACPIAPLTATVGVPFVSDAPVVGGDTPPDTFVLLSGPPWMTIDASTGVVSGMPNANGAVTYTIKVTDSLGNTATVSAPCPLTVNQGPTMCIPPPAIPQENLILYPEPLENQGT